MKNSNTVDLDFHSATIKAKSLDEFIKDIKEFQTEHKATDDMRIIATVVIKSNPSSE